MYNRPVFWGFLLWDVLWLYCGVGCGGFNYLVFYTVLAFGLSGCVVSDCGCVSCFLHSVCLFGCCLVVWLSYLCCVVVLFRVAFVFWLFRLVVPVRMYCV